jgi:HPt (histidine-containing phosphotransfer) domain-containing protein
MTTTEFDWSEALAAVCDDRNLLRDVVEVLIKDLPRLRGNIDAAMSGRDADAVRRAAHSLKGSLRFLGDIPGHNLAQQLEDLATAQGSAGVSAVMDDLWVSIQYELDRLAPILEAEITAR